MNVLADRLRQPVASGRERALLLAGIFLIIALRIPDIWIGGRFWAEEGNIFFRNAWRLSWRDALLAPHANYLNFAGNLVAVLAANLVPLRAAPYFHMVIGIVVQCLPALLLLTIRIDWLQSRLAVLVVLAVMTFVPVSEEVWATATHAYTHLMLCAAIILAFEAQRGARGVIHNIILLFAALSAPGSWFLLPIFAARAAFDRSWPRAVQAAVLLAGVLLQLAFFSTLEQRDAGTSLPMLGAIVLAKHVLTPLLGPHVAAEPNLWLKNQFAAGGAPLWPLVLVALTFAGAIAIAAQRPRQPALWLLLAAGMLAGVGYMGSTDRKIDLIDAVVSGRHAFVPQALVGLALVSWALTRDGIVQAFSAAMAGWILVIGVISYAIPSHRNFMTGPNWQEEVARWQRDPASPLQIWPRGWQMRLPPR